MSTVKRCDATDRSEKHNTKKRKVSEKSKPKFRQKRAGVGRRIFGTPPRKLKSDGWTPFLGLTGEKSPKWRFTPPFLFWSGAAAAAAGCGFHRGTFCRGQFVRCCEVGVNHSTNRGVAEISGWFCFRTTSLIYKDIDLEFAFLTLWPLTRLKSI
ncbi:hypothetical protein Zmor_022225 [Zophobas morio]|uniref:Uncharacterized protein n=1 Tax=Zophobas morio TaxID=2755281 RepID=A0AA38HUX3_9CUCU|nr:hypothetical protein Zmor_022225 [Zophobas morio]